MIISALPRERKTERKREEEGGRESHVLKIRDVKNSAANECLTASGLPRLPPRLSVIIINDAYFNKSSLLLLCKRAAIIKGNHYGTQSGYNNKSTRNNNENNKIGHGDYTYKFRFSIISVQTDPHPETNRRDYRCCNVAKYICAVCAIKMINITILTTHGS